MVPIIYLQWYALDWINYLAALLKFQGFTKQFHHKMNLIYFYWPQEDLPSDACLCVGFNNEAMHVPLPIHASRLGPNV